MYAQLLRKRKKSGSIPPELLAEPFPDARRIDDPILVQYLACRNEKNNLVALRMGLPAVGSKLVNPHGLEFVVEAHAPAPTVHSIQRWRDGGGEQPEDLFPSLTPQNFSPRLTEFINAVDRCTTKTLTVLDTMPHIYSERGVPGGHYIDTISNPGVNLVFIDAANLHETHFAHEIGHAWVQYVDCAEDMRAMEDVSDPQRLHQLHFIQSFVLDLRVNEVIRGKGFDMSVIEADSAATVRSYGRIAAAGRRPETRREAVFTALQLAPHMLAREKADAGVLAATDLDLDKIRTADPECHDLAVGFSDAVRRHGYQDAESIRSAIDECLLLGYGFSEDGIDLDKDLVVLDEPEPDFDKRPDWLVGASPRFKCEVGLLLARNDIPSDSPSRYAGGPIGPCNVIFRMPDGASKGPYSISHPNPWWHQTDHLQMINGVNRHNRERQMQNRHQSPNTPQPPSFPDINGGRRFYMPGYGRFLSAVREAELLGGEHPYAYAMGNPVRYTDPSGLSPTGSDWDGVHGAYIEGRQPTISKCLKLGWDSYCSGLNLNRAEIIHMMRCIIGCESANTGWPGRSIMWPDDVDRQASGPLEIGDPKATGKKGGWNVGPSRINAGCQDSHFKFPYQDWYKDECHNIQDGLALLCYWVSRHGYRLPPYWSQDRTCYDKCMKLPVFYGPPPQHR